MTDDVVLFVESVRWLGVRWGLRSCGAGLRRAGFTGRWVDWEWHSTARALLVLPVMLDSRENERQADRLARHIAALRRESPARSVRLIGYSAGGYIALRALELLEPGVEVESVALLAAAADPRRDLTPAARRVRGNLVVASSPLDVIVSLGTLLLGTADRRFTPSLGAVGYRGPAFANLREVHWTPACVRDGHVGGHFTAAAAPFIARRIAPLMGIGNV
jgi:pimeloyl-ACP methyl ester carboxylesterase